MGEANFERTVAKAKSRRDDPFIEASTAKFSRVP